MSNAILRSYQVFGADDQVLTAAAEAVKQAVKDAKSKGAVQKVSLTRRGHRQDIEVGDVFVVPTSVCDDPADFPTILLNANLRQHTTGEGMVEFQMGALADPKELSREALQDFKAVAFKNAKGDFAPLVVFAASWAHPSAYQSFAYDEDTLVANLRDVAYASPFDPSLSSVFDQLRAVDADAAPYSRIAPATQHIFSMPKSKDPVYPTFAKGLELAGDEGGKTASVEQRPTTRLRRTAADLPEVSGEDLTGDEMSLFQSLEAELGALTKTTDPKQASTYVDPMPMQGETGLRAQPDYGEEGSKETITPDMVDGPDPKTAMNLDDPDSSTAQDTVNVLGTAPQTPTQVENKAPEGADEHAAQVVKEATALAQKHAGTVMLVQDAQRLIANLPQPKQAALYMKQAGLLVPGKFGTLEFRAPKGPAKRSYVLRNKEDGRVWAAQAVEGLIFGGEWTHDKRAAFRFDKLADVREEARRHGMGPEASVEQKFCNCDGDCDCNKRAAARGMDLMQRMASWWNPGGVIEHFYPELQHTQVDSPFMQQEEDPNLINPFGAPGKEAPGDVSMMGLNPEVANGGGTPLTTEMNFYGPEFTRQFYAPKDNITPGALKLKQTAAAADVPPPPPAHVAPAPADQGLGAVGKTPAAALQAAVWKAFQSHIGEVSLSDVSSHYPGVYKAYQGAVERLAGMAKGLIKQTEGGYSCTLPSNVLGALKGIVAEGMKTDKALGSKAPKADSAPEGSTRVTRTTVGVTPEEGTALANEMRGKAKAVAGSGKQANPALLAVAPAIAEAAAPAAAAAAPAAGAGAAAGGGIGVGEALAMIPPPPAEDKQAARRRANYDNVDDALASALQDLQEGLPHYALATLKSLVGQYPAVDRLLASVIQDVEAEELVQAERDLQQHLYGTQRQASAKKAAPALSLFQGLSVASPEEHPQANFDETAPDGQPGAFVEPTKEDAVPQDEAFLSMDKFLKGTVAAYAAQLIGAYKATGKPLALGTPYTDTLDLGATIQFANGGTSPEATQAATAQFNAALGAMNDDQRKMLLDNAVAQASVWCPNTQGSGGFNYEVFVRADKLDGTSLQVKVVTGYRE